MPERRGTSTCSAGLSGLILAEIELEREDQPVVLPWVEGEVTGDARYRNSRLAAGLVPERQAA